MKQRVLITNHGMPNQFFLKSCEKRSIPVDILDLKYNNISGSVLDHVNVLGEKITFDYESNKFRIEEKIAEYYQNKKLDYIYPSWFDFQTRSIAHLNTFLEIPGLNFDYVFNIYDKLAYQLNLEGAGILLPKILGCYEPYSEEYFYNDSLFPAIAKPVRGTGSLGVKVLRSSQEANEFFKNYDVPFNNFCEKGDAGFKHYDYHCLNGQYLLQEYLEGDVISVAGHVVDNKTGIDLIYDIDSSSLPYRAETGFTYPSKHNCNKKLTPIIEKIVSTINLNNTPFMMDFILHNDNYYLIDLSARFSTSAQQILAYLGEEDYAYNVVNKILNSVDFDLKINESIAIRYLPLDRGTIDNISIDTTNCIDYHIPSKGTTLYKSRIDILAIAKGFVAVKDETLAKVNDRLDNIMSTLEVQYV